MISKFKALVRRFDLDDARWIAIAILAVALAVFYQRTEGLSQAIARVEIGGELNRTRVDTIEIRDRKRMESDELEIKDLISRVDSMWCAGSMCPDSARRIDYAGEPLSVDLRKSEACTFPGCLLDAHIHCHLNANHTITCESSHWSSGPAYVGP